jgi:hypothetical protein
MPEIYFTEEREGREGGSVMKAEDLLRDEKFTAVWGEYLAWRKLKGKKYPVSDRVIRSGLETLAEMGSVEAAIKSLNHCMFAGYRGIFPAPVVAPRPVYGQIPDGPAHKPMAFQVPRLPQHTPQELAALQDYKEIAEDLSPADRADLLAKARDTLHPNLTAQLSARIAILNSQKRKISTTKDTKITKESGV